MATLAPIGILAAFQLIVFLALLALCLVSAVRVVKKYGRKRTDNWVYVVLFCVCKFVAAALVLDIYRTKNHTSKGLSAAASVLNNIALSPLLSAGLAFVVTGAVSINVENLRPLRWTHLATLAAVILGVVGGVKSTTAQNQDQGQDAVQLLNASAAVFMAAWGLLALSAGYLFLRFQELSASARKMLRAVGMSLPFLLLRVVYAILAATHTSTRDPLRSHNKYSSLRGDVGWAVLGFLMETAVVLIYAITGILSTSSKEGVEEEPANGISM